MVEVRYTLGMCRIYGKEYSKMWTEVNEQVLRKIRGAAGWDVRDEPVAEPVEVVVDEVDEVVDEVIEEVVLSTMSKKHLQTLCDEKGLEYKAFDTKSELLTLLSDEEE